MFFSAVIIFLVEYSLWYAVYNNKQEISHISFSGIFAYIVYGHILRKLFGEGVDEKIGEDYRQGIIIIDRVRPICLSLKYFFEDFGRGLIQAIIVGIPLIFFLIYKTNGLMIGSIQFIYFIISVFLAYNIYFLLNYILGLLSFWTQSNIGIYMLKTACMGLFSGMYIPLEFYPKWLLYICNILPFKMIFYSPLSLIINKSKNQWNINLYMQILWIIILGCLYFWLQKVAFKKVIVQGG
jgi:ABC-2 type transport system permease protein